MIAVQTSLSATARTKEPADEDTTKGSRSLADGEGRVDNPFSCNPVQERARPGVQMVGAASEMGRPTRKLTWTSLEEVADDLIVDGSAIDHPGAGVGREVALPAVPDRCRRRDPVPHLRRQAEPSFRESGDFRIHPRAPLNGRNSAGRGRPEWSWLLANPPCRWQGNDRAPGRRRQSWYRT